MASTGRAALGLLALAGGSLIFAQNYVISTLAGGVPPNTPAPALNASISPVRVTTDSSGNVFFTSLNCVFKLDQNSTLSRVAGTSRAGYAGDGGPAINAQLNNPAGLVVDKTGNIYVADSGNARIRKISANGSITTIAGNGRQEYSGDGGPAINAGLNVPTGLAFDGAGNLYVADSGASDSRVRKVATNGIITTIAGNGNPGFSGDSGPATAAQLSSPQDVVFDSIGNLYIADSGNRCLRKVSTLGIITTIAGNGSRGSSGDGGAALSASMDSPAALAIDSQGNLFVADGGNQTVRMVTAIDYIFKVAGNGTGYSGDGGPASSAGLLGVGGIAFDSAGILYVADTGRLRKVSQGNIFTIAGNGNPSYSGDGGPAASAQLNQPSDVATDGAGNIYVADAQNARVRKISSNGTITTVAGSGVAGYSGDNGPAAQAALRISSGGVAVDKAGNIYIADYGNNVVRKVNPAGVITTVAGQGNGKCAFSGDGAAAVSAQLCSPTRVAVDASGNLYIADYSNYRVRKVSTSGIITTVAGNGNPGYSGDGGPALSAQLQGPAGVAVDSLGSIYIADYNLIRKVSPDGTIHTVAGSAFFGGGDGGPATSAYLGYVGGVAVDNSGNFYLTESTNFRVRKVASSGIISTIAGNGSSGYSGDGGAGPNAQLAGPGGVAVDGAGNVYVADAGNNAVRLLQPGPAGPALSISAVTNAATNLAGPIAPGEIVSLYGSGLGPAQLVQLHVNSAGNVDTQLAGTTVTFNGTLAPMIFTSATQVAAVVPYGISGGSAQVIVTYQGQASAPASVNVASSAPGLFTSNSSGKGQAAVLNQDGSVNSFGHPAPLGSYVSLFATGEGQTSPAGVDGKPAQVPLPHPLLSVSVTIGGQTVTPLYAGGAPGEVAGVMQVNIQIPSLIQPGSAVPVTLQVGNNTSPMVTIAVSSN